MSETSAIQEADNNIHQLPQGIAKSNISIVKSKFNYYSIYNKNFIKFTLFMNSVGFCRDVFAGGSTSLENKICLTSEQEIFEV